MKHKTWFRLILKAIGILLIGWSIPDTISSLSRIIWLYQQQSTLGFMPGVNPLYTITMSEGLLGSMIQLAFGLYLLLGGAWLVNLCIPSNRPYCPECGYDISHHHSLKCPECGTTLPTQENDSKTTEPPPEP